MKGILCNKKDRNVLWANDSREVEVGRLESSWSSKKMNAEKLFCRCVMQEKEKKKRKISSEFI